MIRLSKFRPGHLATCLLHRVIIGDRPAKTTGSRCIVEEFVQGLQTF
jgi:hypothetical protein